jgi:hypothetical protein
MSQSCRPVKNFDVPKNGMVNNAEWSGYQNIEGYICDESNYEGEEIVKC